MIPLRYGLTAALMNLAWAGGQIIGSAGGGAASQAGGDALPMTVTAALCAVTLAALVVAPTLRSTTVR